MNIDLKNFFKKFFRSINALIIKLKAKVEVTFFRFEMGGGYLKFEI